MEPPGIARNLRGILGGIVYPEMLSPAPAIAETSAVDLRCDVILTKLIGIAWAALVLTAVIGVGCVTVGLRNDQAEA
jgi:hypothetical protein